MEVSLKTKVTNSFRILMMYIWKSALFRFALRTLYFHSNDHLEFEKHVFFMHLNQNLRWPDIYGI